MRLESTTPSFTKTSHDITDNKSIQWQDEIDYEVGFSILEKEFYPFKEVCYGFINFPVGKPAITCSKLTIETLGQSVKYVQS